MKIAQIWHLLRNTFKEWSEDKAPRLAAALAFYTAFSLAPLLVIVFSLAGILFGKQLVQSAFVNQLGNLIGSRSAQAIIFLLQNVQASGKSLIATLIGLATLLFASSGVFGQLQDALNTIWEVKLKPDGGWMRVIQKRFFSFTLVMGLGFLLLVSLIISAVLSSTSQYLFSLVPGLTFLLQVFNFLLSFVVVTLIFGMIFKVLPDAHIAWRDVWLGAAVTALLFEIGKWLIGVFLGNASFSSTYGAAASLVVILLWVYYSTQILFFGAEFTQVYANTFGSRIVPDQDAVSLGETTRSEQGIPHKEALR